MKKILTILAIILLASCRPPPSECIHDGDIIISIASTNNDEIEYTARHLILGSAIMSYVDNTFYAPVGTYTLGDPIHFVKR